jgi:hypothetical protein
MYLLRAGRAGDPYGDGVGVIGMIVAAAAAAAAAIAATATTRSGSCCNNA